MENIFTSSNHTVIPPSVLNDMGVKSGDHIVFKKYNGGYYMHKMDETTSITELENSDSIFLANNSFAPEWLGAEDEEAFKNL